MKLKQCAGNFHSPETLNKTAACVKRAGVIFKLWVNCSFQRARLSHALQSVAICECDSWKALQPPNTIRKSVDAGPDTADAICI